MSAGINRLAFHPLVAAPRPGRPAFTWHPHKPLTHVTPKDRFPTPKRYTPKPNVSPSEQWVRYGKYLATNTDNFAKLRKTNEKDLINARKEVAQTRADLQHLDNRITEIRAAAPKDSKGRMNKSDSEKIKKEVEARVKVAEDLENSEAYVDYVRDEWVARARAAELQSNEIENAYLDSRDITEFNQRVSDLGAVRETPEYISQITRQIHNHLDKVESIPIPIPEPVVRKAAPASSAEKPEAAEKAPAKPATPKKRVTKAAPKKAPAKSATPKKAKTETESTDQPEKTPVAVVVPDGKGGTVIHVQEPDQGLGGLFAKQEEAAATPAVTELPPVDVPVQVVEATPTAAPGAADEPGGWAQGLSGLFNPPAAEGPVVRVPEAAPVAEVLVPKAPKPKAPVPAPAAQDVVVTVPSEARTVVPPPAVQEGLEGLFGPASTSPEAPGVYVVEPAVVSTEPVARKTAPAAARSASRPKPKTQSADKSKSTSVTAPAQTETADKPKSTTADKSKSRSVTAPAKTESAAKPKPKPKPAAETSARATADMSYEERAALLEASIAEATAAGQTGRARALKGQLTRLRNKEGVAAPAAAPGAVALAPGEELVLFPPDTAAPAPVAVPDNLPVLYRSPSAEAVPTTGGEIVVVPPAAVPARAGNVPEIVSDNLPVLYRAPDPDREIPAGNLPALYRSPSEIAVRRRTPTGLEEIILTGEEVPPTIRRLTPEAEEPPVDAEWWDATPEEAAPIIFGRRPESTGQRVIRPAAAREQVRGAEEPGSPVGVVITPPAVAGEQARGAQEFRRPVGAVIAPPPAAVARKRRIWPLALGLGALGIGAGYLIDNKIGTEPSDLITAVPTEDDQYQWGQYPHYGTDEQGNPVYFPGVAPTILRDATVPATDKLQAAQNRLRELGYNPDDPTDVQRFQYAAGIQQDGIIGEQTAAALRSVQRQISRRGYDIWTDPNLPGPQNVPTF